MHALYAEQRKQNEEGQEGDTQMDKAILHNAICAELNSLYKRKNADYGDSFHKTFEEEGIAMARIRLSDKLERFKRLTKSEAQVKDESIRDTLIDLANYAIMTVMELDVEAHGQGTIINDEAPCINCLYFGMDEEYCREEKHCKYAYIGDEREGEESKFERAE